MLLPAVQQVRESARRITCSNNLKQSALAILNYESAHMRFPAGHLINPSWSTFDVAPPPGGLVSTAPGSFPSEGPWWSWMAKVSAFMEQGNFENVADFHAWPWWQFQPNGKTVNSISVPTYVCPSEARGAAVWTSDDGEEAAVTSYLGVSGRDSYSETGGQDGMIYCNSEVTFGSILDGSSNTLLIGERTASSDLEFGWQWAGAGANRLGETDVVLGVHERIAPPGNSNPNNAGTDFYRPGRVDDPDNLHRFHFWSSHPGGGNWALVDGSVRFYTYETDRGNNGSTGFELTVLEMLSTRKGGEAFNSLQ